MASSGVEQMWYELAKAVCLLFVLEGLMPFIAPGRWRQMAARLAQVDDRSMGIAGGACMLAGAGLLYLLRYFQ